MQGKHSRGHLCPKRKVMCRHTADPPRPAPIHSAAPRNLPHRLAVVRTTDEAPCVSTVPHSMCAAPPQRSRRRSVALGRDRRPVGHWRFRSSLHSCGVCTPLCSGVAAGAVASETELCWADDCASVELTDPGILFSEDQLSRQRLAVSVSSDSTLATRPDHMRRILRDTCVLSSLECPLMHSSPDSISPHPHRLWTARGVIPAHEGSVHVLRDSACSWSGSPVSAAPIGVHHSLYPPLIVQHEPPVRA